MNILKKKKLSVKKVILTLVAVLIALLVLISLFAGNYLVNYSIGRIPVTVETEPLPWKFRKQPMIQNVQSQKAKLLSRKQTKLFLLKIWDRRVEITTEDDIHCNGVYYPNGESHDWDNCPAGLPR